MSTQVNISKALNGKTKIWQAYQIKNKHLLVLAVPCIIVMSISAPTLMGTSALVLLASLIIKPKVLDLVVPAALAVTFGFALFASPVALPGSISFLYSLIILSAVFTMGYELVKTARYKKNNTAVYFPPR